MLLLNQKDIFQAVELEEVVDAIEESMKFYESSNFEMPTRMHLDYNDNTLLLMPCSAKDKVGTKLLTLTPNNKEKDMPVIQGCFILNDTKTGEILAIIDGSSLTALRTGAVGAAGIRNITPEDVSSIGVVGAGVQGYHQALFASEVRDLDSVYIFDTDPRKMKEFKEKFSNKKDLEITILNSAEDLVHLSDVIITATPSNEPVLPDDEKKVGKKHFIGIGSYKPEMREFPEAVFSKIDKVFIDTHDAIEETGDIIYPLEKGWIDKGQIYTLGKLLNGDIEIDLTDTTFFKTVGMALFDLVTANLIYEKAEGTDIGTDIEF